MSYGIVRVQKLKSSAVRGIQSHDHRERESLTNPDIDQTKKADNYALVDSPSFNAAIQERLEPVRANNTKALRKDAVVMCQLMVTSDQDFFKNLTPEKEKEFFRQSLAFIQERYGKDNVLSAIVHKDEKTPHMHVNLTPIRGGRLIASEIFTREELGKLHTDFHDSVGKEWGLERGETREDKRRHLSVGDYKRETAKAIQTELEKVQAELVQVRKELDQAKGVAKELEQTKAELDKTKAELSTFKGVQDGTAKAMAQAQAWSIEKARQELERREKERERQAALERAKAEEREKVREQARQTHSRGPSMGR